MDEKLRIVKPYGHIYAGGQDYYLLKPEPIVGDSWERDNTYRFLVTSVIAEAIVQQGEDIFQVFGYARHIVTNCFTIEFMSDMDTIHIPELDETDLSEKEKDYGEKEFSDE